MTHVLIEGTENDDQGGEALRNTGRNQTLHGLGGSDEFHSNLGVELRGSSPDSRFYGHSEKGLSTDNSGVGFDFVTGTGTRPSPKAEIDVVSYSKDRDSYKITKVLEYNVELSDFITVIRVNRAVSSDPGDLLYGIERLEFCDGVTVDLTTANFGLDRILLGNRVEEFDIPKVAGIGFEGRIKVFGGDGNNRINVAESKSIVHTGNGTNTVQGGSGADIIYGGNGVDTIRGGGGSDRIHGRGGNDIIYGDSNSDTISGDSGEDRLYGGEGNDYIFGGSGDDRMYGGEGDDYISGEIGFDTIFGGIGDDKLGFYRQSNDNEGDIIIGGPGEDNIFGGGGSDTIFGHNQDSDTADGEDDSAYYLGDIRDFSFRQGINEHESISVNHEGYSTHWQGWWPATDYNQGNDELTNIEKIYFGYNSINISETKRPSTVIETNNIHFGDGNRTKILVGGADRDIFYGENGGYEFRGGASGDIFQFLDIDDSSLNSPTVIRDFDGAGGDRIAFANIPEFHNLSVSSGMHEGSNATFLENPNENFRIIIMGSHEFSAYAEYYWIGRNRPPETVGKIEDIYLLKDTWIRDTWIERTIDITGAFREIEEGSIFHYELSYHQGTGLSFNSWTGQIKGRLVIDEFLARVHAYDIRGGIATQTFKIKSNTAPRVTEEIADRFFTVNDETVSIDVANLFTDDQGHSLTYTVSGLPSGLSFDEASNFISGTPNVSGDYQISISADDSFGGTVSGVFDVSVGNTAIIDDGHGSDDFSPDPDEITVDGQSYLRLRSGGGNDVLKVIHSTPEETKRNHLYGQEGEDTLISEGGNRNNFYGGPDGDKFFLDHGDKVTMRGDAGDDDFTIIGGDGSVYGNIGDDRFTIDGGDVNIFGGENNDHFTLIDGECDLTGNEGVDTYRVLRNGKDREFVIKDFVVGVDVLELVDYSYNDVTVDERSVSNSDVVIRSADTNNVIITLEELSVSLADCRDYVFSTLS